MVRTDRRWRTRQTGIIRRQQRRKSQRLRPRSRREGQGRVATAHRQQVSGAREAYVGFLLDAASGGVRVILSASGGMDIELVPREQIHKELAAPDLQSLTNCVHQLARSLPSEIAPAARESSEKLARAFLELEAMLIEINPLFVYPDGKWVAGDAKIVTDDNALPRQAALESLLKARASAYPDVARKHEHGFDYVVVDPRGEIGLLTTGAGLSMMLIDELRTAGLKPYNFLDIRTGGLRGETRRLTQVLKWIGEGTGSGIAGQHLCRHHRSRGVLAAAGRGDRRGATAQGAGHRASGRQRPARSARGARGGRHRAPH
jgi:hypothetical protein